MLTIELNYFHNIFTVTIDNHVECNLDLYYNDAPYYVIHEKLTEMANDELRGLNVDEITRELMTTGHLVIIN